MATFFEPPIRNMRVEAFRGFRDVREFDLAASAIIVTGPNGTGKTSFFDALQWCFLGSIQRLEDLRARKTVEHLVNQYRLGDHAVVEVDLLIAGDAITIRRTGDHTGSTLEFRAAQAEPLFGADAENALRDILIAEGDMTLEMALTTSGLMQQDVMRSVLEAKPADRYRHLSTVLGLGGLEDFEQAARDLASDAKARSDGARADRDAVVASVEAAKQRLSAAAERLNALPQLESLRQEILTGARSTILHVGISESELIVADDCKAISTILGLAIDQVAGFLRARAKTSQLAVPRDPEPSPDELQTLVAAQSLAESEVAEQTQLVALAEARYSAATAAGEELANLAAIAIPMLAESCPVCGQSIDPQHVEDDLRARAKNTDSMLALRTNVDESKAALGARVERARISRERVGALESLGTAWREYRSAQARLSDEFLALNTIDPRIRIVAEEAETFVANADSVLDELGSLRRKLLELLNAMELGADHGAMERAASEASGLEELLRTREARLEEESQRAKRLKTLSDSTIDSRVEVTQRRFSAVQPLVANIFSRLDPHPAFKTIEFELDTYYRRGTTSPMVRDLVEGIVADPLVVFSTSQANIAALSYFLAMGISIGPKGLPFVLLDDPVQSMDDVNVLGFADLCRHLRRSRQLIISTHDRRFAGLLDRKLAPRHERESTELIEFVGWDRSGPAVQQRPIEPQLVQDPIRVVKIAS